MMTRQNRRPCLDSVWPVNPEMVYNLLRVLPCLKTHMMYRTNLSYAMTVKLFDHCFKQGLIQLSSERRRKRPIYERTAKGDKFVAICEEMAELLGVVGEEELIRP